MNIRLVSPEYRLEVSVEFVISFTLKKIIFLALYMEKTETRIDLVAKSIPNTQIRASKYHFPFKGVKTPWRNG